MRRGFALEDKWSGEFCVKRLLSPPPRLTKDVGRIPSNPPSILPEHMGIGEIEREWDCFADA